MSNRQTNFAPSIRSATAPGSAGSAAPASPGESDSGARPRYDRGWREGRPVEDPEKTKSWGWITAKPSEYLIHVRRGKILRRSSGQGAACLKLPWDSVAVIPTTIARLQFKADQITREKVGVEVTGLAVFRVVEPELTYKMLNFSFSERASEKLEAILREMFMGSARRLVANMSVEEVLTRRKEGLAAELMHEIAPIVSGQGAHGDRTDRGWGVVIDTIEIQDVRILSETVFTNMQALFRNELSLRAREAELAAAKAIAEQETSHRREIEEARITAEAAMREQKAIAESRAAEIELTEAMKREKMRAAAERAKIEEKEAIDRAATLAAARLAAERREAEQAAALATVERARLVSLKEEEKARDAKLAALAREQAEIDGAREVAERQATLDQRVQEARLALQAAELEAKLTRELAELDAEASVKTRRSELLRVEGAARVEVAAAQRAVENTITEEALRRDLVVRTLPAIAGSFAQNFGEMKFVNLGGGEGNDPVAFVAKAFAQVLEVAKSAGLDVGSKKQG